MSIPEPGCTKDPDSVPWQSPATGSLLREEKFLSHQLLVARSHSAKWFHGEITTGNGVHPLHRGPEKRKTVRFKANRPAILQRLNPLSVETMNVFVVDVSAGGLRLHMPTAIIVGSFCKVKTGDRIVFGPVRYCIPSATGFFAGIRLDECVAQRPSDLEKRVIPQQRYGGISRTADAPIRR